MQTQGLAWSQEGGQDALTPYPRSPGFTGGVHAAGRAVRNWSASRCAGSVDPAARTHLPADCCRKCRRQAQPGFRRTADRAEPERAGLRRAARRRPTPQIAWAAARGHRRQAVAQRAQRRLRACPYPWFFSVKTADGGTTTMLDQPELDLRAAGRHSVIGHSTTTTTPVRMRQSTTGPGMAGPYRLEGTTDRGSFVTELQLHGALNPLRLRSCIAATLLLAARLTAPQRRVRKPCRSSRSPRPSSNCTSTTSLRRPCSSSAATSTARCCSALPTSRPCA